MQFKCRLLALVYLSKLSHKGGKKTVSGNNNRNNNNGVLVLVEFPIQNYTLDAICVNLLPQGDA